MLRSSSKPDAAMGIPSIDLDRLNIVQLVNHLHGTMSFKEMSDWFFHKGFVIRKSQLFVGSQLEDKVMIIFYRDFTQCWIPKWSRQARGVILYLDQSTNSWRLMKYAMPRGAEALTGFHILNHIESTENITDKKSFGIFDPDQQLVMRKLCAPTNSPLNGYLTMKVDGMLLCVTLYKGRIGRIMREVILTGEDEIAKTIIKLADMNHCNFVPVISTQRTFNVMEKGPTFSYIVTALLVASKAVSYFDLLREVKETEVSPVDAFFKYGDKFMNSLKIFDENIQIEGHDEFVTISMEAVCPFRTCGWGHKHIELAINYHKAFINTFWHLV